MHAKQMPSLARRYDVIVAGAGVAGVAAALAAARAGLGVALIEKTVFPGGLATSGLINIYLPLCDGCGHQVTFGIAEELLQLSLRYGPGEVADWRAVEQGRARNRYQAAFSPAAFVLALDEILAGAGVALWLDTLICGTETRGEQVTSVIVENKSGRGAFSASVFIDATGDADVAHGAGAACEEAGNWLSFWGIEASLAAARTASQQGRGQALMQCFRLGGDNAGRQAPSDIPRLCGTDAEDVTRFVLEGRRLLREHCRREQAALGGDGRNQLYPLTLPSMAQFRTTRRIVGQTTLQAGQAGHVAADSIGLVADWRTSGSVWEIPYGTLLPQRVSGLLVAGRCIAAAGDAWEVTRVIPAAALTGQAAGVAAALAVSLGTAPANLDACAVQAVMRQQGVRCHQAEPLVVPPTPC